MASSQVSSRPSCTKRCFHQAIFALLGQGLQHDPLELRIDIGADLARPLRLVVHDLE